MSWKWWTVRLFLHLTGWQTRTGKLTARTTTTMFTDWWPDWSAPRPFVCLFVRPLSDRGKKVNHRRFYQDQYTHHAGSHITHILHRRWKNETKNTQTRSTCASWSIPRIENGKRAEKYWSWWILPLLFQRPLLEHESLLFSSERGPSRHND